MVTVPVNRSAPVTIQEKEEIEIANPKINPALKHCFGNLVCITINKGTKQTQPNKKFI